VRTSHPKFLIDRWKKQSGADATKQLCDWNNKPPLIYARINQLKIDRQSFLDQYRNARWLANLPNFVELPSPAEALAIGDCYVQDPSTAIACQLLDPKPDENILDACAAPGGKTGYIAQLMENRGTIVACDRDPERLQILKENMARLGVGIVRIFDHDWTRGSVPIEIASMAPFHRILLDAPCSN